MPTPIFQPMNAFLLGVTKSQMEQVKRCLSWSFEPQNSKEIIVVVGEEESAILAEILEVTEDSIQQGIIVCFVLE